MGPQPMGDLMIFLPGVMGSVLAKDGNVLWGISPKILPRLLQFEQFVRDLSLAGDDPDRLALDDGVVATALMPDVHLIPGFWKIDGYTSLIDAISAQVGVTLGDVAAPQKKANFFPFPYDWRRDNRANAKRLKRFIDKQLPAWQESSGNASAKVILMAHSMGGLISRYYLECLGGHAKCRALLTFGTPYRGSLNALDSIINGMHLFKSFFDVSPALRSFTSTYQLLPSYPVVDTGHGYADLTQTGRIGDLDPERARNAIKQFIQPMEAAARKRVKADQPLPYQSFLFIGTNQPTKESALLSAGVITPREELPDLAQIRRFPGYGDNTVPFYSALPGGTRLRDHRISYASESHGSLQCNLYLQEQLIKTLQLLQASDDILGEESFEAGIQPGLRLRISDAYPSEGGLIRVEPADIEGDLGDLQITLAQLDAEAPPTSRLVAPQDGAWVTELDRPAPGIYRVQAEIITGPARFVRPVQDLFEVFPAPAA
ncbi:MAG: hypothetical protein HGA65_05205 [Oscillochloris sp.]|nr:hypothetical protein [Oscillochloris sp.]